MSKLVDLDKKRKKNFPHFKVMFANPYDLVRWRFLDYMLIKFGFYFK